MIKEKIKKIVKKEPDKSKELIISDKENLSSILNEAFSENLLSGENNNDTLKELETTKLILNALVNPKLFNSLSNLNDDEIDDISDALYLNSIFQDELINIKINSYIELKRSITNNPKNLLTILSEIAGKGITEMQTSGIGKFLGDRFKR